MAWELQSHMACLIRPSVEAHLLAHDDPEGEAARILGHQRTEHLNGIGDLPEIERIQAECDAEVARLGIPWAVSAISDHAQGVALTSNGAHAVYLDSEGWCEAEFIGDDE